MLGHFLRISITEKKSLASTLVWYHTSHQDCLTKYNISQCIVTEFLKNSNKKSC